MASITRPTRPRDPSAQLDLYLAGVGQGFNAYLERRAAVADMQHLDALSDEDLARRGLRRRDIAEHVLRHMGFGLRAV